MNIIATSPQGLELLLADEIAEFGGSQIYLHKRFISFRCDIATFYRIHFFSKIPFYFYREIARFACYDKKSLYKGVQSCFDWLSWIPPDKSFCVQVTGKTSLLSHSHFTALEVKNSIIDLQRRNTGKRSNISTNNPSLIIHLHLQNGEAILSFQSTLRSLHKRGYRPAMADAPLKENLASGLIQLANWDRSKPLVDIMCGSGTFLIEAIAKELNLPNLQKTYLFQNWIDFQEDVFLYEKSKINDVLKKEKLPRVMGCEINRNIFNQAKQNIFLAGIENHIELYNLDFAELNIPETKGIILCNPPYGKRIGQEEDLRDLYGKIGNYLKDNCSGWEFWLLSGNPNLTKYLKMKASLKIPVSNGGIDCRWIKYLIR